jgi:hypothetical protein
MSGPGGNPAARSGRLGNVETLERHCKRWQDCFRTVWVDKRLLIVQSGLTLVN